MRRVRWRRILGAVAIVTGLAAVVALWARPTRRSTDRDFALIEQHPSPDGRLVLLVYHYDIGALGYTRAWWAVAPVAYRGVNLVPCELPDGYVSDGWAQDGALVVRPWTPYYYKQTKRELKAGETFCGAGVRLLPEEKGAAR